MIVHNVDVVQIKNIKIIIKFGYVQHKINSSILSLLCWPNGIFLNKIAMCLNVQSSQPFLEVVEVYNLTMHSGSSYLIYVSLARWRQCTRLDSSVSFHHTVIETSSR